MGNLLDHLKRRLGATREQGAAAPDAVAAGQSSASTSNVPFPTQLEIPAIDSIIRVEEVVDARFFVNDLFKRRFGSDAPDYPRHFVAFYAALPSRFAAIGYVHYSPFEDSWLCGGMVMDDRAYRHVPGHHRAAIKAAGGVAEIMLRETFARLRGAPAIWGYVGDRLAEVVDLRAGFVHTGVHHVMVVWNRELPEEEKAQRLARVVALGPF